MVVAVRLCGVRGTELCDKSYKPLRKQHCCIAGGTGLSRDTDCFPRESWCISKPAVIFCCVTHSPASF